MGFKEDADFAHFVSMGATGTAAVGLDLRQHGHRPVELERYAMSNKVWQTKVKRLRLPDLVCLHCGLRIESRAKSKLGIVVSHSDREGREWNAGGMRASDFYAFIRVDRSVDPPATGTPSFFTTESLKEAFSFAKRSAPKAASDGSEITLTWPSFVPSHSGLYEGVDADGNIQCTWDDKKTLRYWQWKKWGQRYCYLEPGSRVIEGETIIAGVVPAPPTLKCPGNSWDLSRALNDEDEAERYAAIKAAGILGRSDLMDRLIEIESSKLDWRIRLEAATALARLDPEGWTERIIALADETESRDEARMEAVFALSEIAMDQASLALASIAANRGNASELRAAAAWGLGRGVHPRPDLLLPLTASDEALVSLHAIVAMDTLPDELVPQLIEMLHSPDDRTAASAAHVLSRHKIVKPLLEVVRDGGSARLWALAALGDLPPDLVRASVPDHLDAEIEQSLEPLWLAHRDWLRQENGRDGLDALDVQTIRFDPIELTD